jgi:hypothetical protein
MKRARPFFLAYILLLSSCGVNLRSSSLAYLADLKDVSSDPAVLQGAKEIINPVVLNGETTYASPSDYLISLYLLYPARIFAKNSTQASLKGETYESSIYYKTDNSKGGYSYSRVDYLRSGGFYSSEDADGVTINEEEYAKASSVPASYYSEALLLYKEAKEQIGNYLSSSSEASSTSTNAFVYEYLNGSYCYHFTHLETDKSPSYQEEFYIRFGTDSSSNTYLTQMKKVEKQVFSTAHSESADLNYYFSTDKN